MSRRDPRRLNSSATTTSEPFCLFCFLCPFPAPPFPMELTLPDLKIALDTSWVLMTAFLVFFMNAGFALVESGLCRAKNCVNILAKNYVVFAVSSIAFWTIGFALMFGNGNPYIGLTGFLPSLINGSASFSALDWTSVPMAAKFFFQLVFAGTAATIVSGAVAERIKFGSFIVFAAALTAVIYPIAGHWIWGGGFLSTLATPFHDFAGSSVVHSIGGWAALMGAIILGPRLGRFDAQGKAQTIRGHNMTNVTLGGLILWLGWFGFNPGSTMAVDARSIAHIALTTNLAAAAGTLTALLASWYLQKKPDLSMIINGTLGGLVAVTAGCDAVSMAGAVVIGGIAGVLAVLAVFGFEKLRIDDPVGALSVHLINGVWGTLAVGLFATIDGSVFTGANGLLYGGGLTLLTSQAVGVVAVGAFVVIASSIAWLVIKAVIGLRVGTAEEKEGLDVGEHGMPAYVFDDL
ncbi:MAG: ammonium transporter [Candidatus Peribacteraceae bacterium]|nr:ammonium transporter [Candidatus Peribacteraceae bacterium]